MSGGTAAVLLRAAGERDVASLADLERQLFGPEAWSPSTVRQAVVGSARAAVVAEVNGHVLGYAVAQRSGEVADLERVAVVPAARRSGLATALLRAVADHASREGAERLLLEVSEGNAGARAFYAARGLEEIARRQRYYRDGSAAVVLQLPLRPEEEGSRG